jgi:hypothetical protein
MGSRGGRSPHMDSEDNESDEDRIVNILSGFETVLLSDLHKMVGNQHLGTVCSDIHEDDVLVNGEVEGKLRSRHGENGVRSRGSNGSWTNKYETDRDKEEKQKERERDKEREKEKVREKDSAKDAEREKNDDLKTDKMIAARVLSEVESMRKKLEKNHLIEMRRLSEEIKSQRATIAQLNKSIIERDNSLEVFEKNYATTKKEKEVLLERKAREVNLHHELASLKKQYSGSKQESIAKVAKLEARIITLMRSNAEEKDNLRLEFGARRKKECSELHREIRELKRKLLVGPDAEENHSPKRARRDSSGQHTHCTDDSTQGPGPESAHSPHRTSRHSDTPNGNSEAPRAGMGSGLGSGSSGVHSERVLEADRGETNCNDCHVSLCDMC